MNKQTKQSRCQKPKDVVIDNPPSDSDILRSDLMNPWILSCARAAQRRWLFIAPGRCTAEGSMYIRTAHIQNIHCISDVYDVC